MDPSGSELQELRRLLGELTARVFRIEQALNLRTVVAAEAPTRPETVRPSLPSAELKPAVSAIPARPPIISPASQGSADLESRIGSHWLNRIGISAVYSNDAGQIQPLPKRRPTIWKIGSSLDRFAVPLVNIKDC